MPSALKTFQEQNRQQITGDTEFLLAAPPYAFELRVPQRLVTGLNTIVFQLPVGPDGYEQQEPATVTVEHTVGGIHIVNTGVRERRIVIDGWTATKPRPARYGGWQGVRVEGERSHSRKVTQKPTWGVAVSGLRHLQYLEDGLVRLTSELMSDPATAADTHVIWHDLKHDEHWFVEIEDFKFRRERQMYRYTFKLLCRGGADALPEPPVGDSSFLEDVADGLATIRAAADMVRAAIADVVQVMNEIRQFVVGIEETIDSCLNVADSVTDFVNAGVDFISIPFDFAANLLTDLSDARDTLDSLTEVPDAIMQRIDRVEQAMDTICAHREFFAPPASSVAFDLNDVTIAARPRAELERAATTSTFAALLATATGPETSDLLRQEQARPATQVPYNGVRRQALRTTDSLASLAAQHLGNANLWPLLAAINELRPPYISASGAVGTVRAGSLILIPVTNAGGRVATSPGVFGADLSADPAERALGVDLLLEKNDEGLYDVAIDVAHGSSDVRLARGVTNVQQALDYRLNLVEGNDPIYGLGRRRAALDGSPSVRTAMELTLMSETVSADPRVIRVKSHNTTLDGDALIADLTVEIRGYAQGVTTRGKV